MQGGETAVYVRHSGGSSIISQTGSSAESAPVASAPAPAVVRYMTPVEERFAADDLTDARELQNKVEELERRIHMLDNVNAELEHRLEQMARERLRADQRTVQQLREKDELLAQKEREKGAWEKRYEAEVKSSGYVRDQLRRTEKELHRILRRKYDLQRGPQGPGGMPQTGPGGGVPITAGRIGSAQGLAARGGLGNGLSTSGRDGAGSGNGVFGGLRNLFTSPRSSASPPPQTVAQVVSQGANGTGNGNKPDGRGNPGVGGGGGGLNQEGLNPNAILMGSLGSYNRSEEAYPVSRASYVRQRNALDSLVQFLGL
uniref:Uncharacterized protein n=1 Tax=Pinguiococcus pyrenoidosus TaxID=172671 RepID=A0A7R9UG52_9STRA|mmetsp:Transcript_9597/g.35927  ORF Transcript_9597/g.35927 Transcript_9597/m.35927 type:complete len:315 (+) Transcript_9597:81-1025(+)